MPQSRVLNLRNHGDMVSTASLYLPKEFKYPKSTLPPEIISQIIRDVAEISFIELKQREYTPYRPHYFSFTQYRAIGSTAGLFTKSLYHLAMVSTFFCREVLTLNRAFMQRLDYLRMRQNNIVPLLKLDIGHFLFIVRYANNVSSSVLEALMKSLARWKTLFF